LGKKVSAEGGKTSREAGKKESSARASHLKEYLGRALSVREGIKQGKGGEPEKHLMCLEKFS